MKTRLAIFALIMISIALVVSGCTGAETGYSTWNRGDAWSYYTGASFQIPDMSFEYPYDYHQREPDNHFFDVSNPPQTVSIQFVNHIEGLEVLKSSHFTDYTSFLQVLIRYLPDFSENPGWSVPDISDDDNDLEIYLKGISAIFCPDEVADIQIIEITNTPAYQVSFSYEDNFTDEPYNSKIMTISIFEYDDYVIEISMQCWEGEFLKVSAYYNHLLETFSISG